MNSSKELVHGTDSLFSRIGISFSILLHTKEKMLVYRGKQLGRLKDAYRKAMQDQHTGPE